MKTVAIIGQTLNKNFRDKISGGIQTVERLHVDIFLSQGWKVHFISPSDSESFRDHENFHLRHLSTPSEEFYKDKVLTKHEKGALNREKGADIQALIQELDPDLVINHSFSSSHVRLVASLSKTYPTMCFVHNTSDTAMDIGLIAKLKFYLELTKNGSNLICVSGYQRDTWRQALKKRVDSGSEHFSFISKKEIDQVYDHFCHPIFVKPVTMSESVTDRFIVITRPDPIKNLHKLLELMNTKKIDKFPLDVFIAHPSNLESSEYFVKKVKPPLDQLIADGWDVQLHHNVPRDKLLRSLSTSRGCFIPCIVEAAPVALLEAASYGVRSIVFGKVRDGVLGHAAVDLLGDDHLQLIDVSGSSENSVDLLQKSITLIADDEDSRKNLHEYTLKMHSFSQRTEDIMDLVKMIQDRYVKKPKLVEF